MSVETIGDRLAVSDAQRRLWFIDRLLGPSATYNIPLSVRLEGELDAAALQGALADVVARHESLRTVFPEQGGVPFQQVLPVAEARPALVTEEVTESALAARLAAAAATRHGLEPRDPVAGMAVPRRAGNGTSCCCVLHHIAADGWSPGPLWRDLARAYFARCRGDGAGLCGAARPVRRLYAVAARAAGRRGRPPGAGWRVSSHSGVRRWPGRPRS